MKFMAPMKKWHFLIWFLLIYTYSKHLLDFKAQCRNRRRITSEVRKLFLQTERRKWMLNSKSYSKQYLFSYLNVPGSWCVRGLPGVIKQSGWCFQIFPGSPTVIFLMPLHLESPKTWAACHSCEGFLNQIIWSGKTHPPSGPPYVIAPHIKGHGRKKSGFVSACPHSLWEVSLFCCCGHYKIQLLQDCEVDWRPAPPTHRSLPHLPQQTSRTLVPDGDSGDSQPLNRAATTRF